MTATAADLGDRTVRPVAQVVTRKVEPAVRRDARSIAIAKAAGAILVQACKAVPLSIDLHDGQAASLVITTA